MSRYVLVRPDNVYIPDWITIWIDQESLSIDFVIKGRIPDENRGAYHGLLRTRALPESTDSVRNLVWSVIRSLESNKDQILRDRGGIAFL